MEFQKDLKKPLTLMPSIYRGGSNPESKVPCSQIMYLLHCAHLQLTRCRLQRRMGTEDGESYWMATVTCEGATVILRAVLTETQAGGTHQVASKTRTDIAVDIKGSSMT